MKKAMLTILLFSTCLTFSSQTMVMGASIPVCNPGFEDPPILDPPSWNWCDQDGTGIDPIVCWCVDYDAEPWPSSYDTGVWCGASSEGSCCAFVRHYDGGGQDTGPWQDLEYTIVAGEMYTFTMDVQRRQSGSACSLTFNYHDGGARTAIVTNNIDMTSQADDSWVTYSVSFAAVTGQPYIGKSLGIEFNNTSSTDSWQHFDNVRVESGAIDGECCYPYLEGDLNDDCLVNLVDLHALLNHWMECNYDVMFDSNCLVNLYEFSVLANQWNMEGEMIPAQLCGLYLVAYDDCGQPGKQPNLAQGSDWTYPTSAVPEENVPLDHPARTISFDGIQVLYAYEGMKAAATYKLRITYLCDAGNRVQDLQCDGTLLQDNIALPNGLPVTYILDVPSNEYQDGEIQLSFTHSGGANAVVAEIELWSSDPNLTALRIQAKSLMNQQMEVLVTNSLGEPVEEADVEITIQGTAETITGVTDEAGRFVAPIPDSWKQYSTYNVEITATKGESTSTIIVPLSELLLTMPRLSPRPESVSGTSQARLSLDGTWSFHEIPPGNFWEIISFPPAGWSSIEVPGEWVMQGFTVANNQAAGYLREYMIPSDWAGKRIKLRCDAVYSDADVYINGQAAGNHTGGFTPFELDVTDLVNVGTTNTIALAVTNESLADSMASGTQYAAHKLGGISRKIYLFPVPELNLSALHITTDLDENYQNATLQLEVIVINESSVSADTAQLDISLEDPDGQVVTITPSNVSLPSVEAGSMLVQDVEIPVSLPAKWDCEHPNLYTLTCTLSDGQGGQETIVQKIGFREIEVRGNQLYVNDQPVKLRGVCRHEVYPTRGRSLTDELWQKDAELFKKGNCNFIRTSHYPPAEEFIAACDEWGLFVEDEAPFCWEGGSSDDTHKNLTIVQTLEMVERDRNHPSVLFWSLANESTWGPNFEASSQYVRQADDSRPQIFSYGQVDLVSWHYPGPGGPANAENQPKPTIFDEYCHLNCYNRRELNTDPGVRDDWGRGFAPMWEDMLTSTGCLGGSIWAAIDDAFHLPSGSEVGYGYWGPLDAWRRPKPEYWHMKKAYSPVRITPTSLPVPAAEQPVEVPVSNRFDFTNLNELTIEWSLDAESGTVSANIAPRSTGTLSIDPAATVLDGKILNLDFYDANTIHIDTYALQIGTPPANEQPPAMGGTASLTQNTNSYFVTGTDFEWTIDRQTGQIQSGILDGQTIVTGGPILMILPLNDEGGTQMTGTVYPPYTPVCTNWSASSVQANAAGGQVTVTVSGQYTEASGSYTMTFDGNTGQMELSYSFTSSIDVWPRQVGMVLDVDPDMDILNWHRSGQWTTYPNDHIGRLQGQAGAFGSAGSYVPPVHGVEPTHPWSEDMAELGINDFRSTKRHIYTASLASNTEYGLKVYSDGTQSTRCYVDGSHIRMLIAEFSTGGDDRFFGDRHHANERIHLIVGSVVTDTIRVQLIQPVP